MSEVCSHKKAQIRWKQSEYCWECPAHGSCFSAKRKVTQGPANKNLPSLDKAIKRIDGKNSSFDLL